MREKKSGSYTPFWRNIKVVPYLYILPNMILFLTFMIIPIFMSFYYSTVKWNGLGDPKFIGLENYLYIFTDDVFIKSMFNTVYYSAVTVPILMVLSLLFAVLLNNKIPLRGLIRSSIYAPAVVSTVVVGTVFIWIFQDQLGLINYIITLLGGEDQLAERYALCHGDDHCGNHMAEDRLQYGNLSGRPAGNPDRADGGRNH